MSYCGMRILENMIYSIEQEEQVVDMLERRVKVVLSILNEKLKAN